MYCVWYVVKANIHILISIDYVAMMQWTDLNNYFGGMLWNTGIFIVVNNSPHLVIIVYDINLTLPS